MANEVILLDTSILIDYFRKKDKINSLFLKLSDQYAEFRISVITEFEIYSGAKLEQSKYWEGFLERISVVPFDSEIVKTAVEIDSALKKSSNRLDMADLFIAATAIKFDIPCASLNTKHFERIIGLKLVTK